MANWREQILKEFTPQVARLTLVADPDGLLLEEGILQGIRERGFELIPFEDHVAFRFAYESKFRSRWDRGEQTDLVVVLRSESSDLNNLPYDLLQAGRKLSFSIGELFPNLSYPVVAALDKSFLDDLYEAQILHRPGILGDNATKEFILRHVFEIAPELIKQPSDLLRTLLRRHYRGLSIPAILDDRFIQILRLNNLFEDWPLERILPDRDAFLAFLQERWPVFLNRMAAKNTDGVKEGEVSYGFELSGPSDLPFDHDDVRVYIDNLFLEGLLQAIPHEQSGALSREWVAVGIDIDPKKDRLRRLDGLLRSIKATIPSSDGRHQEWLLFAYRWAEFIALSIEAGPDLSEEIRQQVEELRNNVDTAFLSWVMNRYAGLHNQPAAPPVMLHHIPRALARYIGQPALEKVALLIIDGLALDQWIVIRKVLNKQRPAIRFHEGAVFSWIPTITSVSRQAAFAGKVPLYFPSSIWNTHKEAAHWSQFWLNEGMTQQEVAYLKGLDDHNLDLVEEALSHPRLRAMGLIIDKADKIMHGLELGIAGMHNQIRQWIEQGSLAKLLDLLLERDFQIFLTSDHGNIEAKGCGRPAEGVMAELKGQRVRIYPDESLRSQVKARFPGSIEWPTIGLPDAFLPLLAPGREAFIREKEHIVGHGGISIEELVVPFIQIKKRNS
jgi:hypothetical protein